MFFKAEGFPASGTKEQRSLLWRNIFADPYDQRINFFVNKMSAVDLSRLVRLRKAVFEGTVFAHMKIESDQCTLWRPAVHTSSNYGIRNVTPAKDESCMGLMVDILLNKKYESRSVSLGMLSSAKDREAGNKPALMIIFAAVALVAMYYEQASAADAATNEAFRSNVQDGHCVMVPNGCHGYTGQRDCYQPTSRGVHCATGSYFSGLMILAAGMFACAAFLRSTIREDEGLKIIHAEFDNPKYDDLLSRLCPDDVSEIDWSSHVTVDGQPCSLRKLGLVIATSFDDRAYGEFFSADALTHLPSHAQFTTEHKSDVAGEHVSHVQRVDTAESALSMH